MDGFEEKTILLTGATGLLGSRFVPRLSRSIPGCRIIAVARSKEYESPDPRVEVIHGDLRDKQLWLRLPNTINRVIHLAAFIPWRAEEKQQPSVMTDNVLPIANLIEYSAHWPDLQQVIYSSSVSVYGPSSEWLNERSLTQPASLYGAAKLSGEEMLSGLESKGVRIVSLRLSSLYDRKQYQGTVLPVMVQRARQRQDISIFGDGTRTQDFLHCEDAAHAILLALQKGSSGIYNIGNGTPVTMTELAQTASRVFSDGETKIVYHPEKSDGDPGIKLDVSKARRELNYQPKFTLERGLQKLKEESQ